METTFGVYFRQLRKDKGLCRSDLAQKAGIAVRTLGYWEAGERLPRIPELEAALTALRAAPAERLRALSLLDVPRGLRQARAAARIEDTAVGAAYVGAGDLLRAMRLRAQWTQEQTADDLGVDRSVVVRWENGERAPTQEHLQRLCMALRALPEEQQALAQAKRILPGNRSDLSLEECAAEVERFRQSVLQFASPLIDLEALIAKRHLSAHSLVHPHARHLLAQIETYHASWLDSQERRPEARLCLSRALPTMLDASRPEPYWECALNLAYYHATLSENPFRTTTRFLHQWKPRLSSGAFSLLVSDAALVAMGAGNHEETRVLLQQAERLARQKDSTEYHRNYCQITRARVLMLLKCSETCMEWLLSQAQTDSERTLYQRQWIRALIAAGEKAAAARFLAETERNLPASLPPRSRHLILDLANCL